MLRAAQIALANHQTQEQIIQTLDTACDTLSFLGSSQAVVDCGAIPRMPTVTFSIAGEDFDLTPEQYVLKARGLPCTPIIQWAYHGSVFRSMTFNPPWRRKCSERAFWQQGPGPAAARPCLSGAFEVVHHVL